MRNNRTVPNGFVHHVRQCPPFPVVSPSRLPLFPWCFFPLFVPPSFRPSLGLPRPRSSSFMQLERRMMPRVIVDLPWNDRSVVGGSFVFRFQLGCTRRYSRRRWRACVKYRENLAMILLDLQSILFRWFRWLSRCFLFGAFVRLFREIGSRLFMEFNKIIVIIYIL